MPSAASLQNKVNKLLTKFDVTDRIVYKRVITRTGGDILTGRGVAVAIVDTVLKPQPAIDQSGGRGGPMVAAGAELAQLGDLVMLVSASAITRLNLEDPKVAFVLKATGIDDEEFSVVAFDPLVTQGQAIAFNVVLRSKKR